MLYNMDFTKSIGVSDITKVSDFVYEGCAFRRDTRVPHQRSKTNSDFFVIVKTDRHLNLYSWLGRQKHESILEVGYFEGGSSVFIDRMFKPKSLTCIDRRKDVIQPIQDYIAKNNRVENYRMLTDFDQADTKRLASTLDKFHPNGLDLVFDDASHLYEQTKATFSVAFPRLKNGGYYVIEDYGWAHTARAQSRDHPWSDLSSLSTFIFELTALAASGRGVIRDIYIDVDACIIRKGHAVVDEPFEPLDLINSRGKTIPII